LYVIPYPSYVVFALLFSRNCAGPFSAWWCRRCLIVVSLLFSHRVIFGFLEMGAPLNLPLFPYPLMFAFNNELKDPSFSFSLLFTLISRSTLGGVPCVFFKLAAVLCTLLIYFPWFFYMVFISLCVLRYHLSKRIEQCFAYSVSSMDNLFDD